MNNNDKIKLINIQLLATGIFILTLVVSFILSYDEKLNIQNKRHLFTNKNVLNISLINRIVIFSLAITFLYLSYKDLDDAKKKKKNTSPFSYQFSASILTAIAAFLVLYVAYKNFTVNNLGTSEFENPEL